MNNLEENNKLDISSNVILMADSDTKHINRYRLNFKCNTNYKGRNQAKNDLLELANKFFSNQPEVEEFKSNYNLELEGVEKYKMVAEWIFKNSFYWDLVHQISRSTSNPKRLGYVRLPLKDIS